MCHLKLSTRGKQCQHCARSASEKLGFIVGEAAIDAADNTYVCVYGDDEWGSLDRICSCIHVSVHLPVCGSSKVVRPAK